MEESELSDANKMKDLSLKMEASNLEEKLQMQELEKLKQRKQGHVQKTLIVGGIDYYHQYLKVMKDLEHVKRDLDKLKLDMGSVLEAKIRAENEAKASSSIISLFANSADALRREIQEVNDEQVLAELARIEASKELAEIKALRKEEAEHFFSEIENTKMKKDDIRQEIDVSKELEMKLALAESDIEMLENEIRMVKEMDGRVCSFRKGTERDPPLVLKSVTEELGLAKMELLSIREEGFKLMASMDVIRDELSNVSEQTARVKNKEEKGAKTIENLNSKILRAKTKLDAVSSSEEKARTIVDNLFLTCEHLKSETEVAKKEREVIYKEVTNLRAQIKETESAIESAEMKLEVAMEELEVVRSSESTALERLKKLAEDTMIERAALSRFSSTITISKFEHEYLKSGAAAAMEITGKKVAAAHAWIEALAANQKETMMKLKVAHKLRDGKELISRERGAEGGSGNWLGMLGPNSEVERLEAGLGKSTTRSGIATPARRSKFRISRSPGFRASPRSASFNLKKKAKIMPNLGKFFNKIAERE